VSEFPGVKIALFYGEKHAYTESDRRFTGVPSPAEHNDIDRGAPFRIDHSSGQLDLHLFVASAQQ
jgi:hypothetical protein